MASGPISSWEIDGETVETVTDCRGPAPVDPGNSKRGHLVLFTGIRDELMTIAFLSLLTSIISMGLSPSLKTATTGEDVEQAPESFFLLPLVS